MENMNFGGGGNQITFSLPAGNPEPVRENFSNDEERNSALHFFLYLGAFLALLFVATGLGAILYQIINKILPDAVIGYSYFNTFAQGAVKFGLASIIIATPIFFAISFFINKYLFEGKIPENSKVRKWTTYIILFIAFAIILGDLISLVYNWLGGDMAGRFVLKVLVVLLIAGSIFGYYFWDMRKKNIAGVRYAGNKIAGISSLTVIVIIFVGSFFIVDSPSLARDKNTDAAVVSSMTNYKYSVSSYYQKNKSLPQSLDDLDSVGFSSGSKNNGITYKKTGDYTYQLCADFKTSNLVADSSDPYNYTSKEWKHDKGSKCFNEELTQSEKSNANMNYNKSFDGNYSPAPQPVTSPTF